MPFYTVCHGKKRGVFEKYSDCQESIENFPQPVYKKFETKEEARKYLDEHKIERISLEVDDKTLDKYYAVARGKVAGIFTDYNEVKEHIAGYPKPLYKKHDSYDEALAYFKKFNKGEVHDAEASDSKRVKIQDKSSSVKEESKAKKRSSNDAEKSSKKEEVPKKKTK